MKLDIGCSSVYMRNWILDNSNLVKSWGSVIGQVWAISSEYNVMNWQARLLTRTAVGGRHFGTGCLCSRARLIRGKVVSLGRQKSWQLTGNDWKVLQKSLLLLAIPDRLKKNNNQILIFLLGPALLLQVGSVLFWQGTHLVLEEALGRQVPLVLMLSSARAGYFKGWF